jgi:hypothetical protein
MECSFCGKSLSRDAILCSKGHRFHKMCANPWGNLNMSSRPCNDVPKLNGELCDGEIPEILSPENQAIKNRETERRLEQQRATDTFATNFNISQGLGSMLQQMRDQRAFGRGGKKRTRRVRKRKKRFTKRIRK